MKTECLEAVIGTDESGKGDYFGPLVIAAVLYDPIVAEKLCAFPIRDSKTLSDRRCLAVAGHIQSLCIHSVVLIGPEKYNKLYAQIKNLNRLLAWGHARAIENILQKQPCLKAISDQFGDQAYLHRALMQKGKSIELIQKPRAEVEPAVAAASILARAEFLQALEQLSRKADMELVKGAAVQVEQVAKKLVKKWGPERLPLFAKLHFKNTSRIL